MTTIENIDLNVIAKSKHKAGTEIRAMGKIVAKDQNKHMFRLDRDYRLKNLLSVELSRMKTKEVIVMIRRR